MKTRKYDEEKKECCIHRGEKTCSFFSCPPLAACFEVNKREEICLTVVMVHHVSAKLINIHLILIDFIDASSSRYLNSFFFKLLYI